jgi:hypothetical protein
MAALATIAFAWSGYESAEWVRERFQHSDDIASLSEDALKLAAEADRLEERDTILFVEWLIAVDSGDRATVEAVFKLLRPPVQNYILSAELDDSGVPTVPPFDSENYDVVELRAEAEALETAAREANKNSDRASEIGARYGALGVLFAAVLAAVGIATRFEGRTRLGLALVALCLCSIGLVFMLFSPVRLSF